jgi:hypothetical protein
MGLATTILTQHPSLAAKLASHMPWKLMNFNSDLNLKLSKYIGVFG